VSGLVGAAATATCASPPTVDARRHPTGEIGETPLTTMSNASVFVDTDVQLPEFRAFRHEPEEV